MAIHPSLSTMGRLPVTRHYLVLGTLAAILLISDGHFSGLAPAQPAISAEIYGLAQRIAELRSTRRDIALTVRTDRPDPTYRVGERLTLQITSNTDVFLTVVSLGGSGSINVLTPSTTVDPLKARKGQILRVPDPGRSIVRVQGPPGLELIKVIATTVPIEMPSARLATPVANLPDIFQRRAVDGYAVVDVVIRIVGGLGESS